MDVTNLFVNLISHTKGSVGQEPPSPVRSFPVTDLSIYLSVFQIYLQYLSIVLIKSNLI